MASNITYIYDDILRIIFEYLHYYRNILVLVCRSWRAIIATMPAMISTELTRRVHHYIIDHEIMHGAPHGMDFHALIELLQDIDIWRAVPILPELYTPLYVAYNGRPEFAIWSAELNKIHGFDYDNLNIRVKFGEIILPNGDTAPRVNNYTFELLCHNDELSAMCFPGVLYDNITPKNIDLVMRVFCDGVVLYYALLRYEKYELMMILQERLGLPTAELPIHCPLKLKDINLELAKFIIHYKLIDVLQQCESLTINARIYILKHGIKLDLNGKTVRTGLYEPSLTQSDYDVLAKNDVHIWAADTPDYANWVVARGCIKPNDIIYAIQHAHLILPHCKHIKLSEYIVKLAYQECNRTQPPTLYGHKKQRNCRLTKLALNKHLQTVVGVRQ